MTITREIASGERVRVDLLTAEDDARIPQVFLQHAEFHEMGDKVANLDLLVARGGSQTCERSGIPRGTNCPRER
jgi:hypothetical protein